MAPQQQQQSTRPSPNSRGSHQSMQSNRAPQPDPRLIQAQQQAHQQYQQSKVPHNDYPQDGMTQFCRIGEQALPSPVRPSSRDSQSDYSNPTSFSSIEPPSGSASPGKPMSMSPQPQAPEEMTVQQKKGFFQKSPFARRKSKPDVQPLPSITPSSRNTWGPASRPAKNENISPTRPCGSGRGTIPKEVPTPSPEPVDPRANFQLNIGNNVFDVASPDKKDHQPAEPQEELDPIAQALAELKGVTKQTSLRVSADRYHGLATPQPPATPAVGANLPGGAPTPLANVNLTSAKRGTPPPSYEAPPMSRLGAPKPAHTARQMQKTTEMYVQQKASVFNTGSSSRPSTRGNATQEPPRAASPAPRAVSPQPSMIRGQPQQPASPATYRATSPNPYAGGRPRAQTTSQAQAPSPYGTPTGRGSYSRQGGGGGSPSIPRAASPQPPQPAYAQSQSRPGSRAAPLQSSPKPAYANPRPQSRAAPSSRAASPQPQFRNSHDRPPSSRGSDMAGGMAIQLAPGPGSERGDGSVYGGSVYGGSVRGRTNTGGSTGQRPQSSYYADGGEGLRHSPSQMSSRVRSKSVAEPRQYTRDGRMILHYCEYLEFPSHSLLHFIVFLLSSHLPVAHTKHWWT